MGFTLARTNTACAYSLDNATEGILNVRVSHVDDEGRTVYRYSIHHNGAVLTQGEDLRSAAVVGADRTAWNGLTTLASFLGADAEKYQRLMGRPVPDGEDGYIFDERVAEWAYSNADDLALLVADSED